MKFTFQCLAVTHTSGRVTLTPLELAELAVHASSLDEAKFELTLALDDRISRSHPRHLWKYCTPGSGELVSLPVPELPLHAGKTAEKTNLLLHALRSTAQADHAEVRLLSTDLRAWFKARGKELATQATAFVSEHLKKSTEAELLHLRAEGKAELLELVVEATPLQLSALKPRELHLDERPQPADPDDVPEKRDDDEGAHDDDWNEKRPTKKKAEPKPVATPTLLKLGVKWHQLAKDGVFPPTFGRDALVQQVRAHLAAKDPEPLLLLGPAGVGKTAVLHEVARQLVGTQQRPFFHLDASRLIAGEGFFGDWQRQTLEAFAEAREAKALLYLGRAVDLLDAGKSAHSDDNVAQLLLPTLAAREVTVIAEATPEEWARVRDRHASFSRLFAPLQVDEPTPPQVKDILSSVAAHEGKTHDVRVETPAQDEVRTLVRRFRPYGSPLGNGVSFLRRLIEGAAHGKQPALTRLDVVRRFSTESGIPEALLRDDVALDPVQELAFFTTRVKGQPAAVARVAQVVSVIKANLADPQRPVATLLFAGPTGVGKTELSKALAERLFGSKERMVRLDMGEYAGPDAMSRLLGEAGGDGFLASAVRRQPFSVVLLDEIEKAHPAVFDALLSVLGEGRLTDGRGRLTDFRSTVLVMTSNLGAQTQRPNLGFGSSSVDESGLRAHYLAEIRRFFRPELFNRLDDVVIFNSLSKEDLSTIVQREFSKVTARGGFSRLDVELTATPSTLEALAEWGYEPKYGARPLKRAMERRLVVPAAAHLATHRPAGPSRLDVQVEDGALQFSLAPLPRAAQKESRTSLLEVCEQAAALRAEVRSWVRAPMMRKLRDDVRLFERLSRQKAFWTDHALAAEQAQRAALSKDVWDGFDRVRQQAEAAEELAFEAYGLRAGHSREELVDALLKAREAFNPLTERLFASLFPPVNAVTLTLLPGRGGGRWADWLLEAYIVWARARGLAFDVAHMVPKPPDQVRAEEQQAAGMRRAVKEPVERELAQRGLVAAVKVYREKTGSSLKEAHDAVRQLQATKKWPTVSGHEWRAGSGASWEAVSLQVKGEGLPMLLAGEHGLHRFYDDGNTSTVRVRFVPGSTKLEDLGSMEFLEEHLPKEEVRRVWPQRKSHEQGLLRDLRNNSEHAATRQGFHLSDVIAAYVRFRVFGEEAAWT